MTDDQWRSTLDDLRLERDALGPKDEYARRVLDQLIQDVELHLAASDESTHEPVSNTSEREAALGERLSASLEQFEATHPKLTLQLNQIMMKLSGTGV